MTPIISGLPAKPCQREDCFMCKGAMKECFSEWICPHCESHLSTGEVSLNLWGLSYPSAMKFLDKLKQIMTSKEG